MFYVLSKTLDLLVSPIVWTIALVLLGRSSRRPSARRGLRRSAPFLAIALLLLSSMEPISNALERSLERSAKDTTRSDVTYDAVVLLGGVVDDAGMDAFTGAPPSYNDNVERLLVTYDLVRAGRARYAIITGGTGGLLTQGHANEAHVLGDQLVRWGIDGARVILEDKARNTRENAVFTAEILRARDLRTVVLVTSAFHMRRAEGCFRAVGVDVSTLPVDFRAYDPALRSGSLLPRADAFMTTSHAIREWTGRLVYAARGYAR